MTVTFLGTGTSQGVPVIACDCEVCTSTDPRDNRTRTSVHIDVDGLSLVIDTGPDFRTQVLRESIQRLDAVVFTHQHRDHTAGLDEIRSFNFKHGIDIPIYATKEVMKQLKKSFAYIFEESDYPGIPRVVEHIIDPGIEFVIQDVGIQPIQLLHHRLPVLGYRIKDFVYITDANHISESEKEKVRSAEVLVLNALQKRSHVSHFNLDEALALIAELDPEQAYLVHMSHYMGKTEDVNAELPANVSLAFDGLRINL